MTFDLYIWYAGEVDTFWVTFEDQGHTSEFKITRVKEELNNCIRWPTKAEQQTSVRKCKDITARWKFSNQTDTSVGENVSKVVGVATSEGFL